MLFRRLYVYLGVYFCLKLFMYLGSLDVDFFVMLRLFFWFRMVFLVAYTNWMIRFCFDFVNWCRFLYLYWFFMMSWFRLVNLFCLMNWGHLLMLIFFFFMYW